jgi:hypothetical protein
MVHKIEGRKKWNVKFKTEDFQSGNKHWGEAEPQGHARL